MRVHITNLYGLGGTAGKAQNMAAEIAKKNLHFNELGIYCYGGVWVDSPEMLRTRIDGIIASVAPGDIIIFQHPMWNGLEFEEKLFWQLSAYPRIKKIIFIHDVETLMFGADDKDFNRLKRHISLYNQSDLIILPSQKMADFLCDKGLTVTKVVVQRMWDALISIDTTVVPRFQKLVHFAGDISSLKFSFAKEWAYDAVKLSVTDKGGAWAESKNIECIGWFNNENLLADVYRKNGGFGLLWTEDFIFGEYMKLNACCKLSTYLAAGLPVIVPGSIPEAGVVLGKNLGLAVDSLDEAVHEIECMTQERYDQMVSQVASFGKLLREGYFTKKLLTDAIFKLMYD